MTDLPSLSALVEDARKVSDDPAYRFPFLRALVLLNDVAKGAEKQAGAECNSALAALRKEFAP